jgi:hypothetical protein
VPEISRANGSRYPSPAELVAMLDERGIDKAVILSCVSPACRYAFVTPEMTLEYARRFPDRLIPFAGLDGRMLTNDDSADFSGLLDAYKRAGCRGVGEFIANVPLDDPMNMNLFGQIAEAGLPLTIHISECIGGKYGLYDELHLPRLEKVLKAFPKLKVLGHSQAFWAEISADLTEDVRGGYPKGKVTPGRLVELFREYDNLLGDLSAGSGYNAISRDRDFGLEFLTEFQDRLFFGTDLAHPRQDTPIVEYFNGLKGNGLDEEAWDRIAWKNAAELLELDVS